MACYRLYKKEKLCSLTAIETLFSPSLKKTGGNNSIMAYPWRCVWRCNETRQCKCPQFLISVPKKRLRHAVDRVTMRRRMREAYRLNRHLIPADMRLDIAFIYVTDRVTDYKTTLHSLRKIFTKISLAVDSHKNQQQ